MPNYNVLLATDESTVVDEYTPEVQNRQAYQSEADLEADMIKRLRGQGYEYPDIHNITDALTNLRQCLEELNHISFNDAEWQRFLDTYILKKGDGIKEKTRTIQQDYIKSFVMDNGTTVNVKLIDKKNVHANKVQVINQYESEGNYKNRYDVSILVNGFPLVHCELKRRGVAIKEAFNQIDRYQRDSFWADNGLFEYIQIFIISNGTETKYYSNTTRVNVVDEHSGKRKAQKMGSNSFEFTSFWADSTNRAIKDLVDFIKTFMSKQTLLKVITRYCVFTADENLLVMRPYQIAAVEKIIGKVYMALQTKRLGTIDTYDDRGKLISVGAGGYIWHTTGSGKTLTSFKTAQLLTEMDGIDKVLFVVDRNDLDYQTMKEYDRFEKGAADGNKSTRVLQRQLEDKDKNGSFHEYKIIITTIQKMGVFIKQNPTHPIYNKNVVLIFDECHRSQFGEWHEAITKHFKKYAIFGFTGTPIFAQNAHTTKNPRLRTTQQAFGEKLHTYTVVNAIDDKNVLPFRIDYYNTVKSNVADDTLVEDIDDETILLAPDRVANVVHYVLTHFDQKTMRNSRAYQFSSTVNIVDMAKNREISAVKKSVQRKGFNSIFCTSSISAAKKYYEEFQKQMQEMPNLKKKVALIYSYGVNTDDDGNYLTDENSDDTDALSVPDRDFLEKAIQDYNAMFGTQYDTSGTLFPNYYKDLSLRLKNGEVDMVIVVDMFLTGFDATTLNTLWVDKHLRQHGLIQAFSRTNRILNSVKSYGNIICFRNLRKEVDDAIALFGDKTASGIVLLKSYNDYYNGYDETLDNGETKHHRGYKDNIEQLEKEYGLPCEMQGKGEEYQKTFIKLFGQILRLQNILRSFDEFDGNEILSEADLQDYLSIYNDLHEQYKVVVAKDDVSADIIFEMELVRQIVVNIDYIIALVAKFRKENHQNKEIPVDIIRAINSNPELKPKRELIEQFIEQIDDTEDTHDAWIKFRDAQKAKEFAAMIEEEHLKMPATEELINKIFRIGTFEVSDFELTAIMPPMGFGFGGAGSMDARLAKKQHLYDRLNNFFLKYYD